MCPKDGQNRIAIPKTARAKARGQKNSVYLSRSLIKKCSMQIFQEQPAFEKCQVILEKGGRGRPNSSGQGVQ